MITIYTNEEYSKSYTELLEILKYFSKSDLIKIPQNILKRYIKDRDINHNFSYNPELDIDKQNISKLTQILLANLYIKYFADENERQCIENKDLEELAELEKKNQEEYNIETIFNQRKEKSIIDASINNSTTDITSLTVIPDKENIFKRIFNKIKHILKLT